MLDVISNIEQDLFSRFAQMQQEMERFFTGAPEVAGIRSAAIGAYPAINIAASPEQVDVFVFASGLDPEKLEVSMQQNLLTIAGERKAEVPEGAQVYRRERFNGSFRRVMTLPEDVDPDQVEANYKDGVLHIVVKRKEESRPRKIEVH